VVALTLLAAFASESWGQSKQQSSGNETPKTEQTTKSDQRGTPNQPLSVNVVPTDEQKADAQKKDTEAAVKATDDKKLVEYTGYQVLIGIVTFFIFVLQLIAFSLQARYMKRTVVEMRKTTHATIRATRAAGKSADAAVAAERGRFFIILENDNLGHLIGAFRNVGHLSPGENISIKFCFKNYGKTPCILKEQIIGYVIADRLPDSLLLPLSVKDFPETMIGSGNQTKSAFFSPDTPPTTDQIGAIVRNNARFWLYGRLYYDDVFGKPQVHCFYFRSHSNAAGNHCVLESIEPKDHKKST
jgi:hypothetical protein